MTTILKLEWKVDQQSIEFEPFLIVKESSILYASKQAVAKITQVKDATDNLLYSIVQNLATDN